MLNCLRNTRGQSLPQLMLVIAMMSLMGLAVVEMASGIRSGEVRNTVGRSFDSVSGLLQSVLSTPDLCTANIQIDEPASKYPAANAIGTKVKLIVRIPTYQNLGVDPGIGRTNPPGEEGFLPHKTKPTQNNLPDTGVTIVGFNFEQTSNVVLDTPIIGQESYQGIISVVAEYKYAGRYFVGRRDLGLYSLVINSGTRKLVGCASKGSLAAMCAQMGGIYRPELTPVCQFGLANAGCESYGPGYYISAVNADGTVECSNLNISCPPTADGQITSLVGFVDSGSLDASLLDSASIDSGSSIVPICRPYYSDLAPIAPTAYQWVDTGDTACSAACGGGTYTDTYACRDNTSMNIVANAICTGAGLPMPPAAPRACNTQACDCTQAYNWTKGTAACTAGTLTITNGNTSVLTDNGQPVTGSAQFTCVSGTVIGPSNVSCTAAPKTNSCSATDPVLACTNVRSLCQSSCLAAATACGGVVEDNCTYCADWSGGGATSTGSYSCAPANCVVASSDKWGIGCVADDVGATITHGNSVVKSDTAGSPRGNATMTCTDGVITIEPGATCAHIGCNVTAGVTGWDVSGPAAGFCVSDTSFTIPHGATNVFLRDTIDLSAGWQGMAAANCNAGVLTIPITPMWPSNLPWCYHPPKCTITAGVTSWWDENGNFECTAETSYSLEQGEVRNLTDTTGSPTGSVTVQCGVGGALIESSNVCAP